MRHIDLIWIAFGLSLILIYIAYYIRCLKVKEISLLTITIFLCLIDIIIRTSFILYNLKTQEFYSQMKPSHVLIILKTAFFSFFTIVWMYSHRERIAQHIRHIAFIDKEHVSDNSLRKLVNLGFCICFIIWSYIILF